jgi:hypothetical protein
MESIEATVFMAVSVTYMAIIAILTMNDRFADATKLIAAFALFCLLFAAALVLTA